MAVGKEQLNHVGKEGLSADATKSPPNTLWEQKYKEFKEESFGLKEQNGRWPKKGPHLMPGNT